MPEILKQPVIDRSAWKGSDLKADQSWLQTWSGAELDEIDQALRAVQRDGRPWYEIRQNEFKLPLTGGRLGKIAEDLENGLGFTVLRGLPVENYTLEEIRTIYWGLGSYLGDGVAQNAKGHLIADVKDLDIDFNHPNGRGYVSRSELTPHCDPTDVVGLLCYQKPLSGGLSTIASSMAIFNRMLEEHPEYLDLVFRGYRYNLRSEGATGAINEMTFNKIPIFSYFDNRLSCRFNGNMIRTAQKVGGETLSAEENKVLDYIEQTALSAEFRFDMTLEIGDIQLLCNHSMLHTRSEFVDGEDAAQKRHLMRLWLYSHNRRKLEPAFADRYNTGPRGGCAVTVAPEMREYAA